jgi:hypothetical protein
MEQKTIKRKVKQSIRDGISGIVTVDKDGWTIKVGLRICFLQKEIDAISMSDFAVHIHLKDGSIIRAKLREGYTP